MLLTATNLMDKIDKFKFAKYLDKNFLFENKPFVAVAVSGGPDSMALVYLVNNWIKLNKGKLIALIVDHNIKKNSKSEANWVEIELKKSNIKSKILRVNKSKVIKINMNAVMTTFAILLFCFKSLTNDDANIVKKDKKNGIIIRL